MLAIIDGVEIVKVFPFGKEVQSMNKKALTYSWEQIEVANREEDLRYYYEDTKKSYRPFLERQS